MLFLTNEQADRPPPRAVFGSDTTISLSDLATRGGSTWAAGFRVRRHHETASFRAWVNTRFDQLGMPHRYRYTESMTAENFSRHLIRIARRRAGLSQEELARRAATSQAAISAYESGRRSPSVATLSRILAASGFELRMRLADPDTHDVTRRIAEGLLPADQVDAFARAEAERVRRSRRRKAVGA